MTNYLFYGLLDAATGQAAGNKSGDTPVS